ncbi:hypothetical protein CFter6_1564 [Collimonas fungivorans]|jgi:hypothetical protein|uniref:Uncharacterized protein n=1 Tax=Collimonas fungivorans TaxID=158899 RepID=A0A127P933_9BURK|nr:DUF3619 family protein [Collimonas fungivorans]AMO94268.1 hypothetical protein CFter6_1564 [Collimonas fungivorans]MDB5767586.1 hypothetical protein [Collimonas fungivorans]
MNHKQINFAFKVRHALNENLDHLPAPTADRLAAARKAAMARKKKDAPTRVLARQGVLAGDAGSFFGDRLSWLTRLGVAAPILVGMLLLSGLYQYEQQHRINDTADIDAAVLSDELPPSAYLDNGFSAYLAQQQQQDQ